MKLKTFLGISSGFFLLIAVIHLLRVILNWSFVIGNYTIPNWMSIVAMFVMTFLSFKAWQHRKGLT